MADTEILFLLVMFIGLPMCFNIGSVDAIHKMQKKDYIASQMMIMQLPKGMNLFQALLFKMLCSFTHEDYPDATDYLVMGLLKLTVNRLLKMSSLLYRMIFLITFLSSSHVNAINGCTPQ